MNRTYSIKELEILSGVKAHTIRAWEQRYQLFNPMRTDTNIRRYSSEDLKLLLNISVLSAEGYKISKIAKLGGEEVSRQTYKLLYNNKPVDARVSDLKHAMLTLNEELFMKVIDDTIFHVGFEQTMSELLFPFLKLVGNLWQTGAIAPIQEHFASAIIRQKLVVAIDKLPIPTLKKDTGFLLACPSGEMHELGLLYCNYIIRSRGYYTLFLGTSVPVEDIVKVLNDAALKNVLLSIIVFTKQVKDYVERLYAALPNGTELFLTGAQNNSFIDNEKLEGVQLLNSREDLLAQLNFSENSF